MAWFTNDRDKDGFVGVENHNENRKIDPFKCEKKTQSKLPMGNNRGKFKLFYYGEIRRKTWREKNINVFGRLFSRTHYITGIVSYHWVILWGNFGLCCEKKTTFAATLKQPIEVLCLTL